MCSSSGFSRASVNSVGVLGDSLESRSSVEERPSSSDIRGWLREHSFVLAPWSRYLSWKRYIGALAAGCAHDVLLEFEFWEDHEDSEYVLTV